jgi:hypothetical protein
MEGFFPNAETLPQSLSILDLVGKDPLMGHRRIVGCFHRAACSKASTYSRTASAYRWVSVIVV